uniref:Uncharacterized protein n=1 Tax=Arundo donax TaxID=35708 RepID=A0A0A9CAY0_ARUDO
MTCAFIATEVYGHFVNNLSYELRSIIRHIEKKFKYTISKLRKVHLCCRWHIGAGCTYRPSLRAAWPYHWPCCWAIGSVYSCRFRGG